ncbi:MAG TPA: hypothetical protein VHL09_10025, partial [Dehalococcoidia bacterium]|nr:hypothetical protein [Dehalococcoidia bacterium]
MHGAIRDRRPVGGHSGRIVADDPTDAARGGLDVPAERGGRAECDERPTHGRPNPNGRARESD